MLAGLRIVVTFGQYADHGLADRKIAGRSDRHDPFLRVLKYVQLAESRNIVDPGIGPRIGKHHQAFPDQNSTAIGHRLSRWLCRLYSIVRPLRERVARSRGLIAA